MGTLSARDRARHPPRVPSLREDPATSPPGGGRQPIWRRNSPFAADGLCDLEQAAGVSLSTLLRRFSRVTGTISY